MDWLGEQKWANGLLFGGGGVFTALLVLDLTTGIWLPFPWSFLGLASIVAAAVGVVLRFYAGTQAETDSAGEKAQ